MAVSWSDGLGLLGSINDDDTSFAMPGGAPYSVRSSLQMIHHETLWVMAEVGVDADVIAMLRSGFSDFEDREGCLAADRLNNLVNV